MTKNSRLLAVVLPAVILSSLALGSGRQDLPPNRSAYVPTGREATLVGAITFSGRTPKPWKIDMSADPVCVATNPSLMIEWYVISKGRVANVLVYVTGEVLDKHTFESPSAAAILAHINCRYEPHVLGIRVGQPLRILNVDNTQHNTHPTPRFNIEWNQTQTISSPPLIKTFARPEVAIPFKDNQHPWEKAYVSVFSHPFFAVTGADGSFRIEGLPPGSYQVHAWHELMGEKTSEVDVVPGESRHVEFSFSEADVKDKTRFRR